MKRSFIILSVLIFCLSACQPSEQPPVVVAPSLAPAFTSTPIYMQSDILGIWTREDINRGTLFIIFLENGIYKATHGSPESVVHTGKYSFKDNIITFESGWTCAPLSDDTLGQYSIRILNGNKLYLKAVSDECLDRYDGLNNFGWLRYIPKPTSTPTSQ